MIYVCTPGVRTLCPSREVALRLAAAQGFGFHGPEQGSPFGLVEALYRTLARAQKSAGRPENYLLTTQSRERDQRLGGLIWTLEQAQHVAPALYSLADHPAQFVARRP